MSAAVAFFVVCTQLLSLVALGFLLFQVGRLTAIIVEALAEAGPEDDETDLHAGDGHTELPPVIPMSEREASAERVRQRSLHRAHEGSARSAP